MKTPSDNNMSSLGFTESRSEASILIERMNKVNSINQIDCLQQKMMQIKLNQKKVDNDRFFSMLAELMRQELNAQEFARRLQSAALDSGYPGANDALNLATNSNGQSPLTHALRLQDFKTAKQLIDLGERVTPSDKAMFEIARDSKAAENYGLSRPEPIQTLPVVKYYGLTLGIYMTGSDGTSSQYGHIGPTYQVMTDSVSQHSNRHPDNEHFREISGAFAFSNKAARYVNSTAQGSGADIAERIQRGKTTTIPVNCTGHAMGMSFVPDKPPSTTGYLIFTNRGEGANPSKYGTSIYKIDDVSRITPEFIRTMMNGHNEQSSHSFIMSQIHEVTGGKPPVHHITQNGQKNDNCTIANSRSNIHGILLAFRAVEKGGIDKLSSQDLSDVKSEYKQYTSEMRHEKIHELISDIRKNPNNEDLINLGKEYLKHHPKASNSIKLPLEAVIKNRDYVTTEQNQSLHH